MRRVACSSYCKCAFAFNPSRALSAHKLASPGDDTGEKCGLDRLFVIHGKKKKYSPIFLLNSQILPGFRWRCIQATLDRVRDTHSDKSLSSTVSGRFMNLLLI